MDVDERNQQERIHEALVEALDLEGTLTGWVLVYESMDAETSSAGHFYGPSGMTTWRALGLAEWARQNTLRPDEDE